MKIHFRIKIYIVNTLRLDYFLISDTRNSDIEIVQCWGHKIHKSEDAFYFEKSRIKIFLLRFWSNIKGWWELPNMDKLNDRITSVSVEPKCRLWLREHRHDGWTWDVHNTGTTPMKATIPGDKKRSSLQLHMRML